MAKEGIKTGIHPENSFETAIKENPKKFKEMEEQWEEQPIKTKLQEKARNLNLAMLKKDFETAEKIIPEIEEYKPESNEVSQELDDIEDEDDITLDLPEDENESS